MAIIKKLIIAILILESRLILAKYKPFIVAVTGSVGKTSAKDAVYEVLSRAGAQVRMPDGPRPFRFVRKSEKSLNTEIGLPLTVIGVPNAWRSASAWFDNLSAGLRLILRRREYPDCLVLEVGADHPGDIRRVARWLRPHIAVITRVSQTPVHVEFFPSPQAVFQEKASLAQAVRAGGTVVLYGDDDSMQGMAELVKDQGVSVVSFGLRESCAVRGMNMAIVYEGSSEPAGISFEIAPPQGAAAASSQVTVKGALGQTYMYPLLAATAVGRACGIPDEAIAPALNAYEAPPGRMNAIPGLNGSTIIDDTYNSSPDAVHAALDALRSIQCSGTKIAVLGDMMELGSFAGEEHRKAGRQAAGAAGKLFTVGPRSHLTAEEAVKGGLPADSVRSFDSAEQAAAHLVSIVAPGDIILVKGSQSMRMERVAKALLREPGRAGELLVRQDKEWLEKA